MASLSSIKRKIAIGGAIAGIIAVIGFLAVGYTLGTTTKVTMTIIDKHIDISKGIGDKNSKSHYLVTGQDGRVVELDRPWYDIFDNVDTLYAKAQPGRTVTYECYGIENQGLYLYLNCYKEVVA